ncbi:MAG: hypothetical protein D3922_02410 [Candidatus Electrothrix sp. AR1]|nr:hypothetical protein [Candidatus Electrothrix sp. AR1]
MKKKFLSIQLFHRKQYLFALSFLFLLVISPLPIQAAEDQKMGEDKAHGLYQAGSLYGERSEIMFLGVVQKVPQENHIGTWVVDGSDVLVSEATVITGKPAAGSLVELEGSWLVKNNIFKAYDVRVLNETDPLLSGELIGTVEEMPAVDWPHGIWMVEGRKINVKKGLELKEHKGKAKIGAEVVIKGRYVDGVFTASEFEVNTKK